MENLAFLLQQQRQRLQHIRKTMDSAEKAQNRILFNSLQNKEKQLQEEYEATRNRCRIPENLIVLRIEGEYKNFNFPYQFVVSSPDEFSLFLNDIGLPDVLLFSFLRKDADNTEERSHRELAYATRLILSCIEQHKTLPELTYFTDLPGEDIKAKNLLQHFKLLTEK